MSGKFGEGENLYDSDSAIQAGIQADKETGHYQSRVAAGPNEGLILKHETHPTFHKTIEGEAEVGNKMYRSPEGRLFSFEASKTPPEGYTPYVPPAAAPPQAPAPPLGIPAPKQATDVYGRMAKQDLIPETPIPQVPDTFERTVGGIVNTREPGAGPVDVASLSPEAQKYLKDNAPGEGGVLSSLARGAMRGVAGTVKLAELAGEVVTDLGAPKELGDVLQFAGKEGAAAINKLADYAFPRSAAAANMPKIDLDQFLDDPGKVLTQMNDHLGNAEFWKTSVPEGLGSMVPMLVGGWFKAMRAAPVIKGLMAAGETAAAQALAKQTAKSVGRLAYFTTAGMEGGNFYEDLKKFEKETGQQVPIHIKVVGTLSVGAINGALELVGLEQVGAGKALRTMLGTKPAMDALERVVTPTLLTNVRKAFLGEGGQETAQQLVSNAFTQAGYNPSHKLTEGVAESALAGGFGGIAMGVPAHIYNTPAAAKKADEYQNIDMTQPPVVPGGPVQQGLPGMEGEVPVAPVTKPPPLGTPTGVIETPAPPPVETPTQAPVETPVETPPPTDLGSILAGAGAIEDMSFDDLVKHVQDRLQQAQVIPAQPTEAEVPKAADAILGQPLADSSTLGKEVAAGPREEPTVQASPLGTPASMLAMVTSPEEVVGEYEPGPLFGEKGKAPDMQRFLFENGLTWDEVQAWDTTKLSDLQYEYEAWQQEVGATEPALPTGPAWEAFLDDNDPDKYLGPEPGRYKPEFEEKWWPTLDLDGKNFILEAFREFAAEQGLELPPDLAAPAAQQAPAAQEAAQLAPEILEQLRAAHQAAIETALNEGRMTIEQAEKLGHLATHATLSWTPPAAPTPTPPPVERPQNMVMSWDDFAAGNIPKLQQTIQTSHAALFDTEALATSQFYNGSFPIPREGGILMARQSELYHTDPEYRDQVEAVIQNIAASMVDAHKKMNILRGVYTGGGFGIMYEGQGMTSTGIEAGYALSPDDLTTAWYLMGADKYSAYYKGDVSIREALQNSLDAVLQAIKEKSITEGTIDIEVDGGQSFSIADNGTGMDPETIRDKFLGLFGSTKRDDSGRFGKFGIAKAIILKPTRDATWTIETREFYFDEKNLGSASTAPIMKVAPGDERVGTKITVDGKEYMISHDAQKFVETTEVPSNIVLTWNGKQVRSPFEYLTPKTLKAVKVDAETTLRMTYYKDAGSTYDNKLVIRLADKATGAKLTQNVKTAAHTYGGREALKGCLIVDVETKATVGSPQSKYPFKDSRDELKDFANQYVEEAIAKLTAKPPPPPPPKRKETTMGKRAEFKRALKKLASDPNYQELTAYIDSLGLVRTLEEEFPLAIESTYSGKINGSIANILQMIAYEAVVQYTARAINVSSATGIYNSKDVYSNSHMVYGAFGDSM
jgi:signal transduction histidine kinase